MKKLISLLLFASISYSQPYVSASADARNAAVGSAPTNFKSKLDLLLRAGAISNKGLKIGMLYETFSAIDFNKYCVEIGQTIPITKTILFIPAVELGWIEREKLNTWTAALNLEVIYMITDNLGVTALLNTSLRTDLDFLYGGTNVKFSNYIGIVWVFDKYGE